MSDMKPCKSVALVAHDQKKTEMVAWATRQREALAACDLWGTGTTGSLVAKETGLDVTCLKSGPLGGDQQLGAMISEG
ncbi:MAG: methylglyoxal synthase, partial [Pseudomonadota bacterium]